MNIFDIINHQSEILKPFSELSIFSKALNTSFLPLTNLEKSIVNSPISSILRQNSWLLSGNPPKPTKPKYYTIEQLESIIYNDYQTGIYTKSELVAILIFTGIFDKIKKRNGFKSVFQVCEHISRNTTIPIETVRKYVSKIRYEFSFKQRSNYNFKKKISSINVAKTAKKVDSFKRKYPIENYL